MARKIEKGTIKVAWVGQKPEVLYSKMFNSVEEAHSYAKGKKDYLIFKLLREKELESFSWKVLPYGKHRLYKFLYRIYKILSI